MKKWQKIWLYFLVIYASLHLVRDILQDTGVKTFLSTILVKKSSNPVVSSILWSILNTYFIAIAEIILAIYCIKKNQFGKIGILTISIAIVTLVGWLIYWVYL